MSNIFNQSKLFFLAKCATMLVIFSFFIMALFIIIKKNDPKIPQKEVIIQLKINDNDQK